jgi:hypothetical protein
MARLLGPMQQFVPNRATGTQFHWPNALLKVQGEHSFEQNQVVWVVSVLYRPRHPVGVPNELHHRLMLGLGSH